MSKGRLQIILRLGVRLVCLAIAVFFLCVLAFLNYDASESHVGLGITGVQYGTLEDAKAHPGTLYIETKPGYSCSYTKNADGTISLTLNYGYATEKDYDGIKLHLFVDEIAHQKSELEEIIYNKASAEEQAKIDHALSNQLRVNFTAKISRDFGQNASHYPSRILVNNRYYAFTTEDGTSVPSQLDAIYAEKLEDDNKAYETICVEDGYALTLCLGATSQIMNEETSILGNSTIVLDGYLETSVDYKALGISYSLLDAPPETLYHILVRELKAMGTFTVIFVLLLISSVWAIPSISKAMVEIARDNFAKLKEEGLGECVGYTIYHYADGHEERYGKYENEGLAGAAIIILFLLPFSALIAIIKAFITIFTDIYFFIFN